MSRPLHQRDARQDEHRQSRELPASARRRQQSMVCAGGVNGTLIDKFNIWGGMVDRRRDIVVLADGVGGWGDYLAA